MRWTVNTSNFHLGIATNALDWCSSPLGKPPEAASSTLSDECDGLWRGCWLQRGLQRGLSAQTLSASMASYCDGIGVSNSRTLLVPGALLSSLLPPYRWAEGSSEVKVPI